MDERYEVQGTYMPTITEEFEIFWSRYPKRVKRLDAMKAYQKARVLATAELILKGVDQLLENMPDEARYVPLAASWLNAERWTDEYEVSTPTTPNLFARDWYDECKELHGGQCEERIRHEHRMRMDAFKKKAS
jgi:hypothetical protein